MRIHFEIFHVSLSQNVGPNQALFHFVYLSVVHCTVKSDSSEEEEVVILTTDKSTGFQSRYDWYCTSCNCYLFKKFTRGFTSIEVKFFYQSALFFFSSKPTSSPGAMDLSVALKAGNASKDDNTRNTDNRRKKRKNKPKKRPPSANS